MSIDYYKCMNCSASYRADSHYGVECECESIFCSKECGKLENHQEWNEDEDQEWSELVHRVDKSKPCTCILCRKEKYTDSMLLNSLLKRFNITKEQAINIWRLEGKLKK